MTLNEMTPAAKSALAACAIETIAKEAGISAPKFASMVFSGVPAAVARFEAFIAMGVAMASGADDASARGIAMARFSDASA